MCVCSVCQRSGMPVTFDENGNPIRVGAHKFCGIWCDGDQTVPQALEHDDRLGTWKYPKSLYGLMQKLEICVGLCGGNNESYVEQEQRLVRRLSQHGYHCSKFQMGEHDSFGPLSRVVMVTDKDGVSEWYMYG